MRLLLMTLAPARALPFYLILKMQYMKMRYLILSMLFVIAAAYAVSAQKATNSFIKKENIAVSGECGMCKKKIENAAITAGAAEANWDENSKTLLVSYDRYKTSTPALEKAIAAVGYDTKNAQAANDVYNKLPACCHYERRSSSFAAAPVKCCDDRMACSKDASCCTGGKCDPESKTCASMITCKEKGCCKS
jgi:mercuric ion binding protein